MNISTVYYIHHYACSSEEHLVTISLHSEAFAQILFLFKRVRDRNNYDFYLVRELNTGVLVRIARNIEEIFHRYLY